MMNKYNVFFGIETRVDPLRPILEGDQKAKKPMRNPSNSVTFDAHDRMFFGDLRRKPTLLRPFSASPRVLF
jgi:hypothetical protein